MQFNLHFFLAVLCLLPPVLVLHLIFKKRQEEKKSSQSPFKELLRRPAGESLRIKLVELDEELFIELMTFVLVPAVMTFLSFVIHPDDLIAVIVFFIASSVSSVFWGIRLRKMARERANYKLGFEGERYVGEELSCLIAEDFEIYHDVPFDGFNMDHILVGPRGVFVVETKTRRKPMKEDGKKEWRVQFDGKSLQWPWGSDSHGVEQAKANAKTLSKWLSSAVGENIWTTPILTMPGWMVELKVPSKDFYVLNPKQIHQVCSSFQGTLTTSQISRICHQLDQKCRISMPE